MKIPFFLSPISVLSVCFFALSSLTATSQNPFAPHIDIAHYQFDLTLSDSSDMILGKSTMTAYLDMKLPEIQLNLTAVDPESGKGMEVIAVSIDKESCDFQHSTDGVLKFSLSKKVQYPCTVKIEIEYRGIPQDGLIISTNKFGQRTFFGDNWPDRARHWLPTIDHPSDKATVDFHITAPAKYKVVSNGYLHSEVLLPKNYKTTIWKETVPIPTKVMVIGVANFAWETAGHSYDIPVQTWVYNQNFSEGFLDFLPAVEILDYFQELIGPFSYEKLANVQSKTIYGGMENASCIFYHERSVNGNNTLHGLLAHEIAHQWFGNSVAEMDWPHIWLSEGFATYLEKCYSTHRNGPDHLPVSMERSRNSVVQYFHRTGKPVIDTTVTNLMRHLNTNSYQKGAWILHMLRNQLGEQVFWDGIQEFYRVYENSNAYSSDFQRIIEKVSHRNWEIFFNQWLRVPGHPLLTLDWEYDMNKETIMITIAQKQAHHTFEFPLDIRVTGSNGLKQKLIQLNINQNSHEFSIPIDFKATEVVMDPNVVLLFERFYE